jgi:membrane-bound lytic murein transglycosylase C
MTEKHALPTILEQNNLYSMKTTYYTVTILLLLTFGCTSTEIREFERIATAEDPSKQISSLLQQKGKHYAENPQYLVADLQNLQRRILEFEKIIRGIWGEKNPKKPEKKKYVKYTDQYYSRAQIDFEKGLVIIETLAPDSQKKRLRDAIVTTLLTPEDPRLLDLYSDTLPEIKGTPFLYQQVMDRDGKPVLYEWRAGRYADYLISNKLERVRLGKHDGLRVQFPLVREHRDVRAYKYANLVRKFSSQYGIPESLIYAIIDTESAFNPYAVSPAPAYGLMQVVPSTAGRDVFDKIKGQKGQPSPNYLFDPEKNIDTGSAYLHILQTRYLKQIQNSNSRRFTVISAYNGGAGNVFKTFSRDKNRAIDTINALSSQNVYNKLSKQHPSKESRNYLNKVVNTQQAFQQGNGFKKTP